MKTEIEWKDAKGTKPTTYEPVLVWAVFEGEDKHDTHEAYWNGKHWCSVRNDSETLRALHFSKAEWFAIMPIPKGKLLPAGNICLPAKVAGSS